MTQRTSSTFLCDGCTARKATRALPKGWKEIYIEVIVSGTTIYKGPNTTYHACSECAKNVIAFLREVLGEENEQTL